MLNPPYSRSEQKMSSTKTLRQKIFQKETAPAFILLLNTFVWYLLIYFTLTTIFAKPEFGSQSIDLFAVYFLGMAIAAIAGSQIPVRYRLNLLNIWLLLGVLATFCLTVLSSNDLLLNSLIITFLGVSIGLGLPSCLSYFANKASIEKRGLIGGAIWSLVGISVLILGLVASTTGAFFVIIILGIWRLAGSMSFIFLNQKPEIIQVQGSRGQTISFLTLIRKKEILLFLLPWVMFTVINFAEKPMLQHFFGVNQYSIVEFAEFAFIGIFAFVGGLLADIGGRKRVIIAGFVMLGFEYAILSVFSSSINTILISYVFMTLDGVTWGLLFSVFFTVVWGDLGEHYEKEKFYVLGGVPLLLANLLAVLITPYAASISLGGAFTVASFFLFAAVIPLMYTPETLPEKALKDRDLKSYLAKAQKIVEKETARKGTSLLREKEPEKEDEVEESNAEYNEACKLAEKYY